MRPPALQFRACRRNLERAEGTIFSRSFHGILRRTWLTLAGLPISNCLAIQPWETVVFSHASFASAAFLALLPTNTASCETSSPASFSPSLIYSSAFCSPGRGRSRVLSHFRRRGADGASGGLEAEKSSNARASEVVANRSCRFPVP